MNILGINAFHGDASAALLVDGELRFAVEEERFNRVKHWAGFPALATSLFERDRAFNALDHIAISRDPRAQLSKIAAELQFTPRLWHRVERTGRATAAGCPVERTSRKQASIFRTTVREIHNVEHHRAHLASAFFASPFEEAAVVSVDGFGDFSSVMWGVGKGNQIKVTRSVQFPHSLAYSIPLSPNFWDFPSTAMSTR